MGNGVFLAAAAGPVASGAWHVIQGNSGGGASGSSVDGWTVLIVAIVTACALALLAMIGPDHE
jgi:hypothetical protein